MTNQPWEERFWALTIEKDISVTDSYPLAVRDFIRELLKAELKFRKRPRRPGFCTRNKHELPLLRDWCEECGESWYDFYEIC